MKGHNKLLGIRLENNLRHSNGDGVFTVSISISPEYVGNQSVIKFFQVMFQVVIGPQQRRVELNLTRDQILMIVAQEKWVELISEVGPTGIL